MHSNKTIRALKDLSPKELKQFQRFVHSPFFNTHKNLATLIDIICDASPPFKKQHLDEEKIFKKIFPKEKFNRQKISDLLTYLYRLFEKFIVQMNFQNQELRYHLDLLKSFRERKMEKEFLKKLQFLRTLQIEVGSAKYFIEWFFVENEADIFFTTKDSRIADRSLEQKVKFLDLFYLTEKLKSSCEMINRQNIVSAEYEMLLLDEVKMFLEKNAAVCEHNPVIKIYYSILLTLQDDKNPRHFQELVSLLQKNPNIDKKELRTMYDYAQNYCIKKINSGNTNFLHEIFKIYQLLLQQNLIFDEDGFLSQWDYKNIVTTATRIKEYKWCENFISKYKVKIPPNDRENAFTFNYATLFYSQKKFNEALKVLQKVEFTDVYYSLSARSLLLKIYYEADDFEPLDSLFKSFKIYLKRNKLISKYQYTVHMNLLKMTQRLVKVKMLKTLARNERFQKELASFKEKLNATPQITNVNWLNEMIEELEKPKEFFKKGVRV